MAFFKPFYTCLGNEKHTMHNNIGFFCKLPLSFIYRCAKKVLYMGNVFGEYGDLMDHGKNCLKAHFHITEMTVHVY